MPYCDNKKTIFLHIPKTGGTLVKRLFKLPHFSSSAPNLRPSPQHLTCKMLKERLGENKYDDYYKFTFIRNPWARIVSSYFWRQTLPKKREVLPFDEYIKLVESTVIKESYYKLEFGDHFIPQTNYTDDHVEVFKYENLAYGVSTLATKLNMSLPKIAPKEVKPHDKYWDYYNQQSRSIIENIYREEIEKFNYQFGE